MINALKEVSGISQLGNIGKSLFESNDSKTSGAASPGLATGQTFGEVLTNMATTAMDNIKQGEVASFEGIQGKASTREVVDAVMNAEQSLQTAIAMRDKLVSAFLDITKMQI
nr:flagellar hook-basal body complex protein FliE [uncultured Gellertiella sp.]